MKIKHKRRYKGRCPKLKSMEEKNRHQQNKIKKDLTQKKNHESHSKRKNKVNKSIENVCNLLFSRTADSSGSCTTGWVNSGRSDSLRKIPLIFFLQLYICRYNLIFTFSISN